MPPVINRRRFVAGSLVGAATAAAIPSFPHVSLAQHTVAVRRAAHELTHGDPEVALLKEAVRRLKALPTHHPAHWGQLARYHAQLCGPLATGLDPNAEIHFTWWFFPWHRAYLAVVEHLLQWAMEGDADIPVALPYWDWVRHPKVPPIFEGDPVSNPLAHGPRSVGSHPDSPLWESQTVDLEPFLVGDRTFAEFGGGNVVVTQLGDVRFAPGSMDTGHHGWGHVYVGGDMGDFLTAGFDPIFYAHHANVDRMWEVWLNAGTTEEPHTNPIDPIWADRRFAFQEMNGGALIVRSAGVVDTTAIEMERFSVVGDWHLIHRYRYDRDRLDDHTRMAFQLTQADEALRDISPELELTTGPTRLTGEPLVLRLPFRIATEAAFALVSSGLRVLLRLIGVAMPPRLARISVIVRSEDGRSVSAASRTVIPFLQESVAARASFDADVDVTDALRRLEANVSEVAFEVTVAGDDVGPIDVERIILTIRR